MSGSRRAVRLSLFVAAGAAALYGAYRFATASAPPPVAAGAPAPRFAAVTLDTVPQARTLDDYRGKPLLLNVWATWCDPCRAEMPSMQQLYEAYKDRGLRVVAISIDDAGNEGLIREFAAEHKLSFEILHDAKAAIMTQYLVRGVPESFLISADGQIRATSFAADWASAESRALVERVLLGGSGTR